MAMASRKACRWRRMSSRLKRRRIDLAAPSSAGTSPQAFGLRKVCLGSSPPHERGGGPPGTYVLDASSWEHGAGSGGALGGMKVR
eukprot:CAMPEP_0174696606 /NCGR_PEP_ID=MMETSP1094-20130205/2712_1 /TAXON_ID=156173 /ORGANISM="Chrysochromulina brevifilum, Strain UTEX LB 985" /LENGTH=84 /DNA_ID=CAMNT_0015893417 /DNA_START=417 /DNA_END=671 /DNA_ORIENTATION=+